MTVFTSQVKCGYLPAFILLTVASLFWITRANAQVTDAVRSFDEGNASYLSGDYRGALEAYHRAESAGYVSGALYYNMGNAYFRLDETGQAIRYYEKARRLMPENREILHNLEIVRTGLTDQFSQVPKPFWIRLWERLLTTVGATGFFLTGLLLYLTAAGLFGYRLWTGTRNPWNRRFLTLSLATGLLFLVLAFAASIDRTTSQRAVVIADEVILREAPQPDAQASLNIHEGLVFEILDTRDAWLNVRIPNGTTGWIEADSSAPI